MDLDIGQEVFSSRLFVKRDPTMGEFSFNKIRINLFDPKLRWWSRPYEYKWMEDASLSFFKNLDGKSAIDIATGDRHPGMFILKKAGFSMITGTDLFDINSYKNRSNLIEGMVFVKDDILQPSIKDKFDCLTCISVLEHFHPDTQKAALQNMISYLKPNGCMILTFDMPGFNYPTNLNLYKDTLIENSFKFKEEELKDGDIVVKSSNCPNAGRLARRKLSCYRLFAWR